MAREHVMETFGVAQAIVDVVGAIPVEKYHALVDMLILRQREEVVRCRDCTGMVETWDGYECERFSGEYHRCEPDGFCAWGERKEGGD